MIMHRYVPVVNGPFVPVTKLQLFPGSAKVGSMMKPDPRKFCEDATPCTRCAAAGKITGRFTWIRVRSSRSTSSEVGTPLQKLEVVVPHTSVEPGVVASTITWQVLTAPVAHEFSAAVIFAHTSAPLKACAMKVALSVVSVDADAPIAGWPFC